MLSLKHIQKQIILSKLQMLSKVEVSEICHFQGPHDIQVHVAMNVSHYVSCWCAFKSPRTKVKSKKDPNANSS